MPDKTFKLVELVGVSDDSVQSAIRNAVKRAAVSLKGLSWFEVTQIRGSITARRGEPVPSLDEGRFPDHGRTGPRRRLSA